MKVKAVKRYSDIILKRVVEKDEELEVAEDRGKHLVGQGMVQILEEKGHEKRQ